MIRNLKALGLVLAAAFVANLFASSLASAAQLTSNNYPVQVSGGQGPGSESYTVGVNIISCANVFVGTLSGAQSSIALTPTFPNCATGAKGEGEPILYTTNGCQYVYSITGAVEADHASGSLAITCPSGKVIEAHQYANAHAEETKQTNCTITKAAQNGVGTVTYTSATAAGHVLIEGAIGIANQLHGSCTFGFTINRNDTYHINMTLEATSGAPIHVG